MTPDLGYYIGHFDFATFAHTLAGSLLACLPSGLFLFVLFYLCAKPVCFTLPRLYRRLLLPKCPKPPSGPVGWMIVILSLLLGAWTHNFWDAFTHEHGWFVDRIPLLQREAITIGSAKVHVFLILQELSTLAGFALVVAAYRSWARKQMRPSFRIDASDGWRWLFWTLLIAVSLLISLPLAISYAASHSLHGLVFVRSVAFRTAIYFPLVMFPLLLMGAVGFHFRGANEATSPD